MDGSDKQIRKSCFDELEQADEKIDIYVNNAGIFKATPVLEADHQNDFESVMQTNVMSVWYVAKAASSHMKRLGNQG